MTLGTRAAESGTDQRLDGCRHGEAMGRPCGRGARTVRSTHSCPDLPRRPGQRPRHERDNDPSGPAALTRTCRLFPVSSWDSAWRPLPRTRLTTWLEPRPARTAVPHQPVRGAVPSRGARPPFQNVTPRGGASTTRTHCPTAPRPDVRDQGAGRAGPGKAAVLARRWPLPRRVPTRPLSCAARCLSPITGTPAL